MGRSCVPGEANVAKKNLHLTKKLTLLLFWLKIDNVIFFGFIVEHVEVWKKLCFGCGLRLVRWFSLKSRKENIKQNKNT